MSRPDIQSNEESDQSKGQTPDKILNDEETLKKKRDNPDDPGGPKVDPEHDYANPSGKPDED